MNFSIYYSLFLLLCITPLCTEAQKKHWRKRYYKAEVFKNQKYYHAAATMFSEITKEHPNNKAAFFEAGDCYYLARDYSKATAFLHQVKEHTKQYPKAKRTYALALKQLGKYPAAISELQSFKEQLKDEAEIQEVEREIKGCQLALKKARSKLKIQHLSSTLNSNRIDFAPVPIQDQKLLLSSTRDGKPQLFETKKVNNQWQKPKTPKKLNLNVDEDYIGNGSFSPDQNRFYFSACKIVEGESICKLYISEKKAGTWQKPTPLPRSINVEGATSTQPCVIHKDGLETLFFVSNRKGGKGKLDIWSTSRKITSAKFGRVKNLGASINTAEDDITPFFDIQKQTLFFSTKGRPSFGGFDMYSSQLSATEWAEHPTHLEAPFNSCNDDLYYIYNRAHGGVYIVSNRTHPSTKSSTIDDDICFIEIPDTQRVFIATIKDKSGNTIPSAKVVVKDKNTGKVLLRKIAENGLLNLSIHKNKRYVISIEEETFETEKLAILPSANTKRQQIVLTKKAIAASVEETIAPSFEEATTTTTATNLDTETVQTYYKIQVAAVRRYKKKHYKNLAAEGVLQTEYHDDNIKRIMFVSSEDAAEGYLSKEEALGQLDKILSETAFSTAFVIRYINGERTGEGFRSWDEEASKVQNN
jgi:hypothetical protein